MSDAPGDFNGGTRRRSARVMLRGMAPNVLGAHATIAEGVVPWEHLETRARGGGLEIRRDDPGITARWQGVSVRLGDGRAAFVARRVWARAIRGAWRRGELRFNEDYRERLKGLRGVALWTPLLIAAYGGMFGWLFREFAPFGAWPLVVGGALAAWAMTRVYLREVVAAVRDLALCVAAAYDAEGITATRKDGSKVRCAWSDLEPDSGARGVVLRFKGDRVLRVLVTPRSRIVIDEVLKSRGLQPGSRPGSALAMLGRLMLWCVLAGIAAWLLGAWIAARGWAPSGYPLALGLTVAIGPPLMVVLCGCVLFVSRLGWGFWRRPYWRRQFLGRA